MKIIADASMAVKWVIAENQSQIAYQLLEQDYEIIAPDFILIEVANILWKKNRKNEIPTEDLYETYDALYSSIHQYRSVFPIYTRILELSYELDHPVYDCVYLALAEQEQSIVVTADQRFCTSVKNSKYNHLICMIENTPGLKITP